MNAKHRFKTTNNEKCYFKEDVVRGVSNQINKYLDNIDQYQLESTEVLKIKLCCDGTKISRNVFIVNFASTIINDFTNCNSSFYHFPLGIREIEEEYESLDEPKSFLMSDIKKLP